MLEFASASVRSANPQRAILECLESALGPGLAPCDLVILDASIGHRLQDLVAPVHALCPQARVVAASCAGVIGREGVSESMKDVALMTVRGREFAVAHVDGIHGHNARTKAEELATALHRASPDINMVYLIAPGIDMANDLLIQGFEAVLGPDVTLFGATSGDNMRALNTFQAVDGQVFERAAFAVGFFDPSLEVHTRASHGFAVVGEPMRVTRADGHRILELDGRPAWPEFLARLGLPATATVWDTGPIGALAERLPAEAARQYGSEHLLRAITCHDPDGAMHYPTTCRTGTPLWLTVRDEERIFRDLQDMLAALDAESGARKPVAVFQADCGARGRMLFNRVMKEELVHRVQHPFSTDGVPPPWLGLYGFGEFARLGAANTYHNYTTALAALYRR